MARKQVAQLRPANTTAATLYGVAAKAHARQHSIGPVGEGVLEVCNTSGAPATFRLFHDVRGDDFDETTAIYWDYLCPSDSTREILTPALTGDTERIGVRSSVASALTFTLSVD